MSNVALALILAEFMEDDYQTDEAAMALIAILLLTLGTNFRLFARLEMQR